MDDEIASTPGRQLRTVLRWLGAAAAIAAIVGAVFQVIEWIDSRATPTTDVNAAATPTATDTPKANGDEQFVQAGQCVRSIGDAESPVYEIAACDPGTLRVLARIEQTVSNEAQADSLCEKEAPGFTDYHYSNWTKRSDYVNVVFCLRPA